jgi:hypothetical protein
MKYPSGYGMVFKKVMCDPSIKIEVKALYALLAAYTGSSDVCWPSVFTISACLGCSEQSVRNWMIELRDKGWIEIEYSKGNHTNKYHLIIPPTGVEGIPPTGVDPTSNTLTSNTKDTEPVSTPVPAPPCKPRQGTNHGVPNLLPICFDWTDGTWIDISDEEVRAWEIAYPAVNIEQELMKMSAWLRADPRRKKVQYRRFITGWLSRAQQRGGDKPWQKK